MVNSAVILLLLFVSLTFAFRIPTYSELSSLVDRSTQDQPQHIVSARVPEPIHCDAYTYTCVEQLGNCTDTGGFPIPLCYDGFCLPDNTCPVVPGVGEVCSVNDLAPCTWGLDCSPSSATCVPRYRRGSPGAACTSDDECVYTDSTGTYAQCLNGKCKGKKIGASCTLTTECSGFAYCKAGKCAPLAVTGAKCYLPTACRPSDVCSNNKCRRYGSLGINKPCSVDAVCGDNLMCHPTLKKCRPLTYSGACDSIDDCAKGILCGCDGVRNHSTCLSGVVNPPGLVAPFTALSDCVFQHKCLSIACSQLNCPSEYCAYRAKVYSLIGYSVENCYMPYFRSTFGNYFPDSCP